MKVEVEEKFARVIPGREDRCEKAEADGTAHRLWKPASATRASIHPGDGWSPTGSRNGDDSQGGVRGTVSGENPASSLRPTRSLFLS